MRQKRLHRCKSPRGTLPLPLPVRAFVPAPQHTVLGCWLMIESHTQEPPSYESRLLVLPPPSPAQPSPIVYGMATMESAHEPPCCSCHHPTSLVSCGPQPPLGPVADCVQHQKMKRLGANRIRLDRKRGEGQGAKHRTPHARAHTLTQPIFPDNRSPACHRPSVRAPNWK